MFVCKKWVSEAGEFPWVLYFFYPVLLFTQLSLTYRYPCVYKYNEEFEAIIITSIAISYVVYLPSPHVLWVIGFRTQMSSPFWKKKWNVYIFKSLFQMQ